MKKRSLEKFRKFKGIRKAETRPMFLLELKGKKHAKKNLALPEIYINKILAKCSALENKEVSLADNLLYESREEAMILKASMCQDKELIGAISTKKSENSPLDVRINRRNATQRNSATASYREKFAKLVKNHELIIDIDGCLQQRIYKMQNMCSEKINAYILGVKHVDPEFSYHIEYDNNALKQYKANHEETDAAIESTIALMYVGGNQNEMV